LRDGARPAKLAESESIRAGGAVNHWLIRLALAGR
jgi:hypothetical protein